MCPPWKLFDEYGCPICAGCTADPLAHCGGADKVSFCPEIFCLQPQCNYGTIYTMADRCCHYCGTCQTTASSECKNLVCESTDCGRGAQAVAQFDKNGCQLCPICKTGCPLINCVEPACNKCQTRRKTSNGRGCSGCDECVVKPDMQDLPACYKFKTDPVCKKTFAFIRANTEGCCRITPRQCLDDKCPNMYCEVPTCEMGKVLTEHFDGNKCKLCPICK